MLQFCGRPMGGGPARLWVVRMDLTGTVDLESGELVACATPPRAAHLALAVGCD